MVYNFAQETVSSLKLEIYIFLGEIRLNMWQHVIDKARNLKHDSCRKFLF